MGGATRRIGDALGDTTPAIKYNLSDHLGSSAAQLDTNGTTVSLEEYYPFGETSFGSYAKKRYRFCGKEKDEESGLYYYGMRYYSAWTCRFINVDPLAGKTIFMSPYAYANCNPIMMNDPTGGEAEGIPEGSNGNATSPTSQTSNNVSTEDGPNTTTAKTDTSGVSTYYYKETGSDGNLTVKSFTVNDGLGKKYYQHDQGTHTYQDKKYLPIVSDRSFTGHEDFDNGTDDVLVKDFPSWMVDYMKSHGVRNMDVGELLLKVNNGRSLDVAYYQGTGSKGGDNPLADLAEKSGSKPGKNEFYYDELNKEMGKPPYFTQEYSDAMFLLPTGDYGNANEAANYFIGFANGYSNANVPMSDLGQIWSIYDHLFNSSPSIQLDEPHKQNLIRQGGIMGSVNYYIYWWENIGSKLDVSQWAKKEQQDLYNSYKNKYKGNPLIGQ